MLKGPKKARFALDIEYMQESKPEDVLNMQISECRHENGTIAMVT